MKTLKPFLLLIFLFLLFARCNQSSHSKKAEDDSLQFYPPTPAVLDRADFRNYYRQLNSFFDTALLNKGFNGGILIAKDGAVMYEKYYGRIDLRKKDTLTAATSMHVASTSKTFTATAILRLIQEGKLSLDDSISKFFTGLPYPGITVKMLLCHRSGLPNYLYFMSNNKWGMDEKGKWNRRYATNEDVLKMMMKKKPDPTGRANGRHLYCNTNYVLLALIIEKISGMSFPEYMQQNLFRPLKMENTYIFTLKDTLTATPSFTSNGTYWNFDFLDATYGDKNVYTTPQDLLKWDQALYTDQILTPAMLDSAFTGYSPVLDDSTGERKSEDDYGLGWRLEFLPNGKKVVYHFGKWHGSNAVFARLINDKATIIIIGNRFNRAIYGAGYLCYDVFGDYMQHRSAPAEGADSTTAPAQTEKKVKQKSRR
jgi:CubicO group peptidase (beta-lactamase class C family)